jgi:protein SCO1
MRFLLPTLAAFFCIVNFAIPSAAHDGDHHDRKPPSGPASAYAFPLPGPGTYRLPPIRAAAGGRVLTEDGAAAELAGLLRDRLTVFSFIYTRCADICPVATMQLAQLRELARRHPELDGRLRLVSMSFDPEHDTPSIMAEYGSWWRDPLDGGAEWLFLTAPDHQSLQAVIAAYDQAVAPKPDQHEPTGGLNHILRVFLVDEAGLIRNIYSMDFLDPDLVLTDLRTLIRERATQGRF